MAAGRCGLVTGASRGIGRAVAERLAAEGARVVVAARSERAIAQLVESLPGAGHLAVTMDVGEPSSVADGLAEIERKVGHLDLLIANAGIADSDPFDRVTDETFQRLMNVNLLGVVRLARTLIGPMIDRDWGRIVVVASNAGLTAYPYASAYCASKHAVIGWMRAVASEIARSGVTINAVCPGWVDTQMADEAVARIAEKTGKSLQQARAGLESMSPQQRMVQPREVAHLVATLCAEHARGIHGQALPIDGGQVLR